MVVPSDSDRPSAPNGTCSESKIASSEAPEIVTLSYEDLVVGKDLTAEIKRAYGSGGLGILYVRGVPGLEQARQNLLPLSRKLALLPEEVLRKYECEHPAVGWSRGKEMFRGKPDRAKGSFYANPLYDDAAGEDEQAKRLCKQTQPNVWPRDEIPELEVAFKHLGNLVYEVSKPIVKQVDRLVEETLRARTAGAVADTDASDDPLNKKPRICSNGILYQRTFLESKMIVARLLHYYGISEEDPVEEWCGWHNDNSTITGLVPAIWFDEETGEPTTADAIPKGSAGLFVEGRNGEQVEVRAPRDCLGFQIGEASQILSGGVVHATPHMVKGYISKRGKPKLSRETFAVFIQPNWDGLLEPPMEGATGYERIFQGRIESKLIPPLRQRLKSVPTSFGKFLQESFDKYYSMNNP